MKVLVTGASGFLGSHIVEVGLERGHEVFALVRAQSARSHLDSLGPKLSLRMADLRDAAAVEAACAGIDLIIHSAGRVTDVGTWDEFYADNVTATENLLNGARKQGVAQFVFVSSPSIFAGPWDHLDADESLLYPQQFANFYAKSKAQAEQKVLAAHSAKLWTCSLRPRGIWGPRDWNGFFPKLLTAMQAGKLRDLSRSRKVLASLCHARNMADACFQAALHRETAGGQAYFIADAETVDIWTLIASMGEHYALPPVRSAPPEWLLQLGLGIMESLWSLPALHRKKAPPLSRYALGMLRQHSTYSIDKARRDFAYNPRYSISRDLPDFLVWVESIGGLAAFLKRGA